MHSSPIQMLYNEFGDCTVWPRGEYKDFQGPLKLNSSTCPLFKYFQALNLCKKIKYFQGFSSMHGNPDLWGTGTCAPSISNNLFFSIHFGTAWSLTATLHDYLSKHFTVSDSISSYSFVMASWIYLVSFCVTKYFYLDQVFCPSPITSNPGYVTDCYSLNVHWTNIHPLILVVLHNADDVISLFFYRALTLIHL